MAPMVQDQTVASLRMVTQRLSTTHSTQLPHVAAILACSITESRKAFAISQNESNSRFGSDLAVVIHKLKTKLSALLQDKSPHARFSALILIKATVEAGGWNVLQGAAVWVREMINMIGRPDSPASKKLCIMTLSRIFLLTHKHQSLLREITTPSLAPFITTCIHTAKPPTASQRSVLSVGQSPLLLVVLQAFSELIVLHPTSFRPFVHQVQMLLLPLVAATPSNATVEGESNTISKPIIHAARHLFVSLHVCAPKNTAAEEWLKSFQEVVASSQRTADRLFRGIIEEWRPRTERVDILDLPIGEVVSDRKPQPLALPAWFGVHAGVERLDGLLCIIQAFLSSTTSTVVALPVSITLSLVDRILSILQAGCGKGSHMIPEIGRDEREGIEVGLPQLHQSSILILACLMLRLGSGYMAMLQTTLERALWVVDNEHTNDRVRRASYTFISRALTEYGFTLPSSFVKPISQCIRLCCEDLLPSRENSVQESERLSPKSMKQSNKQLSTTNPDSYLNAAPKTVEASPHSATVVAAAEELLPLTLKYLPNGYLSMAVRSLIDRTAILTDNGQAMLASVMNPPAMKKGQQPVSSILPMLARHHDGDLGVEALLHPQMPVMEGRRHDDGEQYPDDEEVHPDPRLDGPPLDLYEKTFGPDSDINVNKDNTEAVKDVISASFESDNAKNTLNSTPNVNSPFVGIPPPVPDTQNLSDKRDRDSKFPPNTATGESITSNARGDIQIEEETPSKRPRLISPVTEQDLQTENSVNDITASGNQPSTSAVPPPSLTEMIGGTGPADSDESEFEMPTLYVDTDSDEENDDEDDG